MTRRDVMKTAVLATANLSILAGMEHHPPNANEYLPNEEWEGLPDWPMPRFTYRGIPIHWTGWKQSQSELVIRGQWIAYLSKDGPYLGVDIPAKQIFSFGRGEMFDLTVPADGDHRKTFTAQGRKELLKKGRDLLMSQIDKYLDHGRLRA